MLAAGLWLTHSRGIREADDKIKSILKEAERCRNYVPPQWAVEAKLEAERQRLLADKLHKKWSRRLEAIYSSRQRKPRHRHRRP